LRLPVVRVVIQPARDAKLSTASILIRELHFDAITGRRASIIEGDGLLGFGEEEPAFNEHAECGE
jgi:hypothetical protein